MVVVSEYLGQMRYTISMVMQNLSASMARLDARMTDDQEVAGSNPTGSVTFFRGN